VTFPDLPPKDVPHLKLESCHLLFLNANMPLALEADSVVYLGFWHSEKTNKIEGKPSWFSLLFYPGLACYGNKMVVEKACFSEKTSRRFFRSERDSA